MKIAINANIVPGAAGGVQSALIGLVSALAESHGDDDILVITRASHPHWIDRYLSARQRSLPRPPRRSPPGAAALLARAGRRARGLLGLKPQVPCSDGFFESLGADVLHFFTQSYERTSLPAVYNPHDLQHIHMPWLFDRAQLAWRSVTYDLACREAQVVCVASRWVRDDVVRTFGISPAKVQVIPWAPPTVAYRQPSPDDVKATIARYRLPARFAFYPAVSWPHKNHAVLLAALARCSDRELCLVLTGHRTEHWPVLARRISELGLRQRVRHLGVVPGDTLRALYRAALFVVVPSRFEAASGPLFEAWQENVPAAVAAVTSLPEQAGDAALLFDPDSVEELSDVLDRLSCDANLRAELIAKGRRRLADFDWHLTARAYRAVYLKAAGRPLDTGQRELLTRLNEDH